MASGASAPRPFPCCYRAQRAVPAAGVWRLGAADDAHAAERECGVLPALPPDPRAEAALGRDMRRTFRSQLYSLSATGRRPRAEGLLAGWGPGRVLPSPVRPPC